MKTATIMYDGHVYGLLYEGKPPKLVVLPDDTLLAVEWSSDEPIEARIVEEQHCVRAGYLREVP